MKNRDARCAPRPLDGLRSVPTPGNLGVKEAGQRPHRAFQVFLRRCGLTPEEKKRIARPLSCVVICGKDDLDPDSLFGANADGLPWLAAPHSESTTVVGLGEGDILELLSHDPSQEGVVDIQLHERALIERCVQRTAVGHFFNRLQTAAFRPVLRSCLQWNLLPKDQLKVKTALRLLLHNYSI